MKSFFLGFVRHLGWGGQWKSQNNALHFEDNPFPINSAKISQIFKL